MLMIILFDAGSTNMIEDLVEILDSKYNNHEIWKNLEKSFIEKYNFIIF